MKPPFFGSKVVTDINVRELFSLIDKEILFSTRWQFRKGQTTKEWEILKKEKLEEVFNKMKLLCEANDLIKAKILYGYFKCKKQGNRLIAYNEQDMPLSFECPRKRQEPHISVSDFFDSGFIAMQLVTIGSKIIDYGAKLLNENNYSDSFFLRGVAAEITDALAIYSEKNIKKELNVSCEQGLRFSFGYPALPNLMDNKKLYDMLKGNNIGVKITKTFQFVPEYSTSAVVSLDKEARYFRP